MARKVGSLLVVLFINVLFGCVNPQIGKVLHGGSSIEGARQDTLDFGDDFRIIINHETSASSIHFNGNLECKKTLRNSLHNWDRAIFTLSFYFLDNSDTIIEVKQTKLHGDGDVCQKRKFDATFHTDPRFRKLRYYLDADLMAF